MSEQRKNIKRLGLLCSLTLVIMFPFVFAEEPAIQTPPPVIYLADNLDEKDNLGWCIDTVGRGFAERLHAHSCKPRGGDVQFLYDQESLTIQSATFENKCVTIENLNKELDEKSEQTEKNSKATTEMMFMLLDCIKDNVKQQFMYNDETLSFHPQDELELCLSVGETSRSAGPFMSRSLHLATCSETDAVFKQWIVMDGEH